MPDDFLAEILVFAKPIAKAIERSFFCERVNMITVGLEVPHAHIHLIPTNHSGDVDLGNKKLNLTPEAFTEIQRLIIEHL